MHTLFSHIVQKRLSQVNEDVATESLAYVLGASESARNGMMKLLRGIVPDMPTLHFQVQQTDTEGTIRPDMWGYAEAEPRVFVENKFWAGLTDNQPVSYLQRLAECTQPTVLLVVAPAAREQAVLRELDRRLRSAGISTSERSPTAGVAWSIDTGLGPVLALTSWTNVLSVLEHEAVDDPHARADLVQLRALCDAADVDSFAPVSGTELSDQRTPAFILQLGSIVQSTVELAVTRKVLNTDGLRPQASWGRIGRYVWMSGEQRGGPGAWLGIEFDLWKAHGTTPLWVLFSADDDFGRGPEVRALIEPWATRNNILTTTAGSGFAIALPMPVGEEKDAVICSLVEEIAEITTILVALPSAPYSSPDQEQGQS